MFISLLAPSEEEKIALQSKKFEIARPSKI